MDPSSETFFFPFIHLIMNDYAKKHVQANRVQPHTELTALARPAGVGGTYIPGHRLGPLLNSLFCESVITIGVLSSVY